MNRTTFKCCRCCRKCCRHTHTITLVDTQHCASSRNVRVFLKMCVADVAKVADLWGVGGIGIRAGFRYQCLRT